MQSANKRGVIHVWGIWGSAGCYSPQDRAAHRLYLNDSMPLKAFRQPPGHIKCKSTLRIRCFRTSASQYMHFWQVAFSKVPCASAFPCIVEQNMPNIGDIAIEHLHYPASTQALTSMNSDRSGNHARSSSVILSKSSEFTCAS